MMDILVVLGMMWAAMVLFAFSAFWIAGGMDD